MTFLPRYISCALLLLFVSFLGYAQENAVQQKSADTFLEAGKYAEALAIYLPLHRSALEDPLLKYKIGLCYYHSANQKMKAIGYFEFAKKYRNDKVPPEVYYYLGSCYHLSYRFVEAINMLNLYLDTSEKNTAATKTQAAHRLIKRCESGIALIKKPINTVSVKRLDYPINTSYQEHSPLISNDGRMLIFSSDRPPNSVHFVHGDKYTFMPPELQSKSESVHTSTLKGIDWRFPVLQDEIVAQKIKTLSISSDNSMLLLEITPEGQNTSDIYLTKRRKGRWSKPRKVGGRVNSKYSEKGACFSENAQVIYLSSNRPGGYGGYDLYKLEKTGKNEWGNPQNLGPTINTEADEINPFVHPDTKTLFFSANSTASMGGFDVFQSKKNQDKTWEKPKNLGYPLNSTFNDEHFTQVPNGQYGYLSSDRIENDAFGQYDIIGIFRPQKKYPLTMMKGIIRVQQGSDYLPVTLKVFETDTDKEQSYVYDPDSETGNYFAILRPQKHYTLSIRVKNREIHKINVDIPEKTYSYELNRKLEVEPFELLGKEVGMSIKVDSAGSSYEITKKKQAKSGSEPRYDAMILLMQQIIARVDTEGWAKLNDLEDDQTYEPTIDFADLKADYHDKLFQRVNAAFETANAEILANLKGPQTDGAQLILYDKSEQDGRKNLAAHTFTFAPTDSRLGRKNIQTLQDLSRFVKSIPKLHLEFTASGKNIPAQIENYHKITAQIRFILQENGIDNAQINFQEPHFKERHKALTINLSLFRMP